jgi:hypothetical protein
MGTECKATISWTYFEYSIGVGKRTFFCLFGIVMRLCKDIWQKVQWLENVLEEKEHNIQDLHSIGWRKLMVSMRLLMDTAMEIEHFPKNWKTNYLVNLLTYNITCSIQWHTIKFYITHQLRTPCMKLNFKKLNLTSVSYLNLIKNNLFKTSENIYPIKFMTRASPLSACDKHSYLNKKIRSRNLKPF